MIETHLRPGGHDALIRLATYFSNPTWAAEAIKKFSTYDVEGHGYISPKFFIEYVTELPLERALQKENPTPKEVRARADRGTE